MQMKGFLESPIKVIEKDILFDSLIKNESNHKNSIKNDKNSEEAQILTIKIFKINNKDKEFEILKEEKVYSYCEMTLGNEYDSDIFIESNTIKEKHIKISINKDKFVISPLTSSIQLTIGDPNLQSSIQLIEDYNLKQGEKLFLGNKFYLTYFFPLITCIKCQSFIWELSLFEKNKLCYCDIESLINESFDKLFSIKKSDDIRKKFLLKDEFVMGQIFDQIESQFYLLKKQIVEEYYDILDNLKSKTLNSIKDLMYKENKPTSENIKSEVDMLIKITDKILSEANKEKKIRFFAFLHNLINLEEGQKSLKEIKSEKLESSITCDSLIKSDKKSTPNTKTNSDQKEIQIKEIDCYKNEEKENDDRFFRKPKFSNLKIKENEKEADNKDNYDHFHNMKKSNKLENTVIYEQLLSKKEEVNDSILDFNLLSQINKQYKNVKNNNSIIEFDKLDKFIKNNTLYVPPKATVQRHLYDSYENENEEEKEIINSNFNNLEIRNFMQILGIPRSVEKDEKKLSFLLRDFFKVKLVQVFISKNDNDLYYIKVILDIEKVEFFYSNLPIEFNMDIGNKSLFFAKKGNFSKFFLVCKEILTN